MIVLLEIGFLVPPSFLLSSSALFLPFFRFLLLFFFSFSFFFFVFLLAEVINLRVSRTSDKLEIIEEGRAWCAWLGRKSREKYAISLTLPVSGIKLLTFSSSFFFLSFFFFCYILLHRWTIFGISRMSSSCHLHQRLVNVLSAENAVNRRNIHHVVANFETIHTILQYEFQNSRQLIIIILK